MSDGVNDVDQPESAEIERVKAIIRQRIESAEPGRTGGLLNADGKTLSTAATRALDGIIDELTKELAQVTGEETDV